MSKTRIPKKMRQEIYRRAEGQCEAEGPLYKLPEGVRCMNMLGSTWHADHVQPEACGGETDLSNLIGACVSCHLAKTASFDIPRIAKNTRVREKATGVRRTSNPLPGGRNSRWKKRMDGTVVER